MNSADHSVLVFLLSAIEAAPNKSSDLLAVAARRPQASEDFRAEARKLTSLAGDEKALIASSEELRKRLR